MATSEWGPATWKSLFISIMGRYPMRINTNSQEHLELARAFKNTLLDLRYTLPCVYCRRSYVEFTNELDINGYLVGRIELMYWLYLIKDKVNKKLIAQEQICYNRELSKLKLQYKYTDFTQVSFQEKVKELQKNIFKTIKSPPFESVLAHYESFRAVCSESTLSCN